MVRVIVNGRNEPINGQTWRTGEIRWVSRAKTRKTERCIDQSLEFNRFGIELLAPCGNGLLALALHRMRGHADDWDVPGLRIVLETPHGFPTIVVRHFEVHQDHVRVLARG